MNDELTITIVGSEEQFAPIMDAVINKLVSKLLNDLEEQAEQAVHETIGKMVTEKGREITERMLTPMVQQVISDGFPQTDVWGAHKGPPIALRDFIRQQLTYKLPNNRESWVSKTLETVLRDTIGKEMAKEIALAKKQFRKAVDDRLGEKLAQAAREAAGLRL